MTNTEPFRFRLDTQSGVPVYRQLIDQVLVAKAAGSLVSGEQLPTVRQVAVDLAINPNTVIRAYRELEIRGILSTQQGLGTFVSNQPVPVDAAVRKERLSQMAAEFASRAGAEGFSVQELVERLQDLIADPGRRS